MSKMSNKLQRMNLNAKKHWDRQNELLNVATTKYPSYVAKKAERAHELIRAGRMNDPICVDEVSLASMLREVEAHMELTGTDLFGKQKTANNRRKQKADAEALAHFYAWEKRVAAAIAEMSAKERVRRYCSTQRLTERQRRRIRSLCKDGHITPQLNK